MALDIPSTHASIASSSFTGISGSLQCKPGKRRGTLVEELRGFERCSARGMNQNRQMIRAECRADNKVQRQDEVLDHHDTKDIGSRIPLIRNSSKEVRLTIKQKFLLK
jgi:hypothetical protein